MLLDYFTFVRHFFDASNHLCKSREVISDLREHVGQGDFVMLLRRITAAINMMTQLAVTFLV